MDAIEICNIALTRIGVAEIERMDEASEPARICNRFYNFVRQNVLRKYPWSFAMKRVQLALVDEQAPDFKYVYQYPADALALRLMYNESFMGLPKANQYKIMNNGSGRKIYTNVPRAWIEYTADIKDASSFDAEFVESFAWKLAAEIAFSLTGNMNITNQCVQAYNAYFLEAAGDDASEDNMMDPVLDRLALARFDEEADYNGFVPTQD